MCPRRDATSARRTQGQGEHGMSIRLLDTRSAERLCDRINSDKAFNLVARDMTLNLAVEVDGETR
jgi:hypothetical protein